jgi:hypothetical protein
MIGTVWLIVLILVAITPAYGSDPSRTQTAPLIFTHTKVCPVPPAGAVLIPCVCDQFGKNCRPVVESREGRGAQATLSSPWCQCALMGGSRDHR